MAKDNILKIFRSQKGFTFIEILAVIVILGILAGLAVTRIQSSSESAKNTQIKALMHETLASIERYNMAGGEDAASSPQVVKSLNEIRSVYGSILADPNDVEAGFVPSYNFWYVKAPLIEKGAVGQCWSVNTAGYEGNCPL